MEAYAWESIGRKIVHHGGTWYNVDDVSYGFCDVVREHFRKMHHIAGGATLMAHCAKERECIATESLERITKRLSHNFTEYEYVFCLSPRPRKQSTPSR